MKRDWLPHLILANLALFAAVSGGIYLAMDDAGQSEVEERWKDFVTPWIPHEDRSETANQTLEVRMPPRPYIVWSTLGFSALGSFYLAAAMAGFIHREEQL